MKGANALLMDSGEIGHHGQNVPVIVKSQDQEHVTIPHQKMEENLVQVLVQNQNPVQMASVLEMESGKNGIHGQNVVVIVQSQDLENVMILHQQMEGNLVLVQV